MNNNLRLIQRFPDHVKAASTFRELYYFLLSFKHHTKLLLNRGIASELLHLECVGPVIESFLENACDAWPEEVYIPAFFIVCVTNRYSSM